MTAPYFTAHHKLTSGCNIHAKQSISSCLDGACNARWNCLAVTGSLFTFLCYKNMQHKSSCLDDSDFWVDSPKFLLPSCFNSYTSCFLILLMQRFVLPAQNLLLYSFKPYGLLNTCSVFEKLWVQPAVLHWFVLPAQNLVFYSFYSNRLWQEISPPPFPLPQ